MILTESKQSAIMRSLERILADEKFASSPQMSAFLRYVVTETLEGKADRIKAYTVAVDALGKSTSFDPQNDPSVRVLAKRLRTSLDQFYQRTQDHEMIIEIRCGSYKPLFSNPNDTLVTNKHLEWLDNDLPMNHSDHLIAHSNSATEHTSETDDIKAELNPLKWDDRFDKQVTPLVGPAQDKQPESASENVPRKKSVSLEPLASAVNANSANSFPSANGQIKENKRVQPPKAQRAEPQGTSEAISTAQTSTVGGASKQNVETSVTTTQSVYSLVTKYIGTFRLSDPLNVGVILVAIAIVLWGFTGSFINKQNPKSNLANMEDTYMTVLASANGAEISRERPAIPTLVVRNARQYDKLSESLLSSIGHVISKFDRIQVVKVNHEYDLTEKWPEDYEVIVDSLSMVDSTKITMKLVNSASGRVAYSDEIILDGPLSNGFSKDSIAAIEARIARIVQKDGPLLTDYKKYQQYSDAMACVYSVTTAIDNKGEACLETMSAEGQFRTVQHNLRTELRLRDVAKLDGAEKEDALHAALVAAEKSVNEAPFSADAHALMMRAFQLSGNYSTAHKHGEYALSINDFESNNLVAFASLLEDMEKPDDANIMRQRAKKLEATLPGE